MEVRCRGVVIREKGRRSGVGNRSRCVARKGSGGVERSVADGRER
jgi:hypothetical protein